MTLASPSAAISGTHGVVATTQRGVGLLDGSEIYAQRVDAIGNMVGAPIHVNQASLGDQTDPKVAIANDGSFVVSYLSGNAAYVRQFAADGIRERVSRWWISPFGWARTLSSGKFDWLKLVRKEYGTPVSWVSNAFALIGWEAIRNVGWAASQRRLLVLLGCWLPLAMFWIVARTLKKNGSLGFDVPSNA